MGKHSKEKENKKNRATEKVTEKENKKSRVKEKHSKKIVIWIIVIIILGTIGTLVFLNREHIKNKLEDILATNLEQEQQVLTLKSLSEPNKTIKYKFKDDYLNTIEIQEQFEDEKQFEMKKNSYEESSNINIVKINEKDKVITIQKKDLGTDSGLSYNQIYDKYLVQMIGEYEQI